MATTRSGTGDKANIYVKANPATSTKQEVDLMYYARDNITNHDTIETLDETNYQEYLNRGLKPTSMRDMFDGCYKLTTIPKMENIDTSQCTDMAGMFFGCNKLSSIDISNLDTSNVTDMSYMFYDTQPQQSWISNLKTSKVTSMRMMFASCKIPGEIDVSNLDTSNVTDMSYMFADINYNYRSTRINYLNKLDTSKVTNMEGMFGSVNSAQPNGSTFQIASPLEFDTSNVTNMKGMFSGFSIYTGASGFEHLNLKINTSNVEDMSYMFFQASSGTHSPKLSSEFKTTNCKNMRCMFNGLDMVGYQYDSSDSDLYNSIKRFDMSKVEDAVCMLPIITKYTTGSYFNISDWDLSSLKRYGGWFNSYFKNEDGVTLDMLYSTESIVLPSNFYTKVFPQLEEITSFLPSFDTMSEVNNYLSKLDTQNVKEIHYMLCDWHGAKKTDELSLTMLNLSSLINTDYMFFMDSNFFTRPSIIDMSNIDMSKVTSSMYMFYNNTYITTINGIIDLTNNTNIDQMFYNCTNLTGVKVRLGSYTQSEFESKTGIKRSQYTVVD